ncbi:Uncharacterised protein [uncultured archaeon]|nr:Uncharacterised protein [uncultured archaeon]
MIFIVRSQSGIEIFLLAVLVMVFFILAVSYFFQSVYSTSNPTRISSPTAYTTKGIDCVSQKVQLNWNDQQLQDCLTNASAFNHT